MVNCNESTVLIESQLDFSLVSQAHLNSTGVKLNSSRQSDEYQTQILDSLQSGMGSLSLSAVSKLKRSVSHKRKLSKKMLPLIKRELEIEENLHRSTEKLIQSIIDCNIDNLKASLDSGANVNAKYNNWSLLHYACSMIDDTSNLGTEQHLEMIRVLLENGAEINTEDEDKWTPLHLACQQGMTSVISYLIKKGADKEASTIENLRPIDLVEPDNYIAISFLISSSVKVNERHL